MSRRSIALLALALAFEAIVVTGRAPRLQSVQGGEILETVRIVRLAASAQG